MHSPRFFVGFVLLSLLCLSTAMANELPRRPFLGVTADPAPDKHVRIGKIVPNSSAARSELAVGDILLALNRAPIDSVDAFLAGVKAAKSGNRLLYRIQRGGKERDIEVALGEWPREQPGDIQVLYDSVEAHDATVRSILTMPLGNTRKLPSILFVQGFDCGSVDWPLPEPNLNRELVYRLTRAGFAVMRSEKSGVGDSTGTPCRDVDFHNEVSLFDLAQLEDEERLLAQFLHYILVEKSSVREATAKHPELTAIAKKLFAHDDEHFEGFRSLQHVRQLNDQNIARAWASLDVPVLALVGEFDIRTLPMDHEYIAAIVNAHHPGKGSWKLLPKLDHGFAVHESLQESVAHEFVGPFGDQVVQETVRWMREIVG